MPSGRVHTRCSLILSVPCFAVGSLLTGSPLMGAACAAGCLAGVPLTPDLDQESLSHTEWALIKWTMGLGFLWPMLWYPYARALKHRSVFSHFPVLGTVGRLAYLGLFLAVPVYFGLRWPHLNVVIVLWAVAGLVASDTAHWVLDTWWCETFVNGRGHLHLRCNVEEIRGHLHAGEGSPRVARHAGAHGPRPGDDRPGAEPHHRHAAHGGGPEWGSHLAENNSARPVRHTSKRDAV